MPVSYASVINVLLHSASQHHWVASLNSQHSSSQRHPGAKQVVYSPHNWNSNIPTKHSQKFPLIL